MRKKTCKICKEKYEPLRPLQVVCSYVCGVVYTNKQKEKAWKKEKKEIKEKLQTVQELTKLAQIVFNAFIRERDKDKPCISCGNKLIGKFDAGHYYSAGGHMNVRFDEDNVHGQCVSCNQHKHGNLIEYGIRLEKLIGAESFEVLRENAYKTRKYTREELKTIIEIYKKKKKDVNN